MIRAIRHRCGSVEYRDGQGRFICINLAYAREAKYAEEHGILEEWLDAQSDWVHEMRARNVGRE